MKISHPLRLLIAVASVAGASYHPSTLAHGYMDFPPARQTICANDGGYWGSSDGSQIPNAACRAAFLESGWYPFVQQPEFARQVSDYRNQSAVESAIPDGSLCAAADSKKAGIDLPSPAWQATPVSLDSNGQLALRYRAETPHNPSFWQFYLSKPSYDSATQALNWADLELVDELDNIPVTTINGLKYYEMNIDLPAGRSGQAVLYSRWQRIDPAGEGFYNCSDIVIDGSTTEPSPWLAAGPLLTPTFDANDGDTVWFRVFNSQGQEQIFEQLAITTTNQDESIWASELAQTVNSQFANIAQIGIQDPAGAINFSTADLYANRVYLPSAEMTFQLEIKTPVTPPPIEPPPISDTTWDSATAYTAGSTVLFRGKQYTAQWWTQGDQPGQAEVWKLADDGTVKEWSADTAYQAKTKVTFQGQLYQAKWWTKGDTPTSSGSPWQRL